MPSYCIVQGCNGKTYKLKNRENESPISFFKIPKNENIKKKWTEALLNLTKQTDPLTPSGTICAAHFSPNSFIQRGLQNKRLKPDAVPSIFPKLLIDDVKADCADSATPRDPLEIRSDLSKFIEQPLKTEINNSDNDESEHSIEHSASTSKLNVPGTPTKSKLLVRYPGDVSEDKINQMTPRTMRKTLNILRSSCEQKKNTIKRLRVQASRQKRKIESMKDLLVELKRNTLISHNAHDVLQVFLQKL